MGNIMKVGKQCKWPPWLMLLLGIFSTVVGVVLFVYNYLDKNGPRIPLKDISGSAELVPHTSRMFPVPGLFCDSIILTRSDWDKSNADLSWYGKVDVVFEKPSGDFYTIPIARELELHESSSRWYARHYYLHARSQISIRSCLVQQDSRQLAKVCLIKSSGGFNSWLGDLYKCTKSNMHQYSLEFCNLNSTTPQTVPTFNVTEDDTYYIVHYTTVDNTAVYVEMNISMLSYNYNVKSSNISCTVKSYNSNTTSPAIPVKSHGYAVVAVIPYESKDSDWSYEDSIRVSWKCKPSWMGFLFVIGIPGIFVITCYFVATICCSFKAHLYLKHFIKKKYQRFKVHQYLIRFIKKQYRRLCPCSHKDTAETESETQRLVPMDSSAERKKKLKSKCLKSTIITCISLFMAMCLFTYLEGVKPVKMISTPSGLVLTPEATRMFSINKFFCSSLSVEMDGSSHLSASIWITTEAPSLGNYFVYGNFFYECDESIPCYRVWRTHLHKGSAFVLKIVNDWYSEAYFRDFTDEDSFNEFLRFIYLYGNDGITQVIPAFKKTTISLSPDPGEHFFVLFTYDNIKLGYFDYTAVFGRVEYNTSSNFS